MLSFKADQSLSEFQSLMEAIYGLPDDRLYTLSDLLVQQQRFTMRSLKGIRQNDKTKIILNMTIAFSWLMSISNRLHIDLESEVWQRFPGVCSYCSGQPCVCAKVKPKSRQKNVKPKGKKPDSLANLQKMFEQIYPVQNRTIADAGVHLAEEMGEVSEAVHNYSGQHKVELFEEIKLELADYISCLLGLANSIDCDMSKELAVMYRNNCHICHEAPCVCSYASVAKLRT